MLYDRGDFFYILSIGLLIFEGEILAYLSYFSYLCKRNDVGATNARSSEKGIQHKVFADRPHM